jgi:hypothetical protein
VSEKLLQHRGRSYKPRRVVCVTVVPPYGQSEYAGISSATVAGHWPAVTICLLVDVWRGRERHERLEKLAGRHMIQGTLTATLTQ